MNLRRLAGLTAAGALALALAAPVGAADNAMVRVLHGSPDAPAVDVLVNDGKVLENVPFGALSEYLSVPGGTYNIKVCATGTDTCVIDADLTFGAGKKYTVAASNALASIEASQIEDNASPAEGNAQVRVVHLSADAPAVDVAPDGGDALLTNIPYKGDSGYADLPGGTYDLEVRVAGEATVALDLDPITVENGTSYSVFAIGSAASEPVGGNGLQVVIGVDGIYAPATDTVPVSNGAPMLLLAAVAAFALAISVRFVPARVRR
jgi:hypothetical protein